MNLAYGQSVVMHPISNRTHDVQVRQEDHVAEVGFLALPDGPEILPIQSLRRRGAGQAADRRIQSGQGTGVPARAPLPSAYRPLPTALHALAP